MTAVITPARFEKFVFIALFAYFASRVINSTRKVLEGSIGIHSRKALICTLEGFTIL